MPTYGYRCVKCGHQFEVRQAISDLPLNACPQCGGELRKLLYPMNVIFKGSGFYSTDYKSSSDGAGESKSETGSETAAEPKKKSKTAEKEKPAAD